MRFILKFIDDTLDRITMYRLTLYVLVGLLLIGVIEGAFGILRYAPSAILLSAALALATCWGVNELIAGVLRAAKSTESVYITAFIIALILPPASLGDIGGALTIIAASALAMAAKYVFVFRKKHFLNPAAFGVFAAGLLLGGYANWWAGGSLAMLPFVFIGGLAIVRKIRRFDAVLSVIFFALATIVLTTPALGTLTALKLALIHTPIIFFASVMLTEPFTLPPSRTLRILYGAFTGILFAPAISIAGIHSSPELALLIGNLFSFIVSPKGRYALSFLRLEKTGESSADFIFHPDRPLSFTAGQYLEWTLPHESPDTRGTRRFFTIASSPTESEVRLGVKFYGHESTFKKALAELVPGENIFASGLAGEFTLPKDEKKKLVFIAGGIGVTPFRSILRYLLDTGGHRDIVLLYGNRTPGDIAYAPIFKEAEEKLGTKVVHIVGAGALPGMRSGMITAEVVTEEIPDFRERIFYISGPQAMVTAIEHMLETLGVPSGNIRTDYFIGLV